MANEKKLRSVYGQRSAKMYANHLKQGPIKTKDRQEKINQTMCHSRYSVGQKKTHVLWDFPSNEQVTCCADNIAIYFSQILCVVCRPGKNESGSVRTLLRTELTDGSRKEMTQCCNRFIK